MHVTYDPNCRHLRTCDNHCCDTVHGNNAHPAIRHCFQYIIEKTSLSKTRHDEHYIHIHDVWCCL
jgi:hypothetical protein